MRDKVRRFIAENSLLQKGDSVLVALSGGADSVALLELLSSIKEEYNLTIAAAHFNHGIRGDEADRDEDFVSGLCQNRQIQFFHEKADIPSIASRSGESLELCGRRLRYRFLENTADRYCFNKVATAHHADDNAETVLWNLTRGAGVGGLCGIPAQRGRIVRPLLCCSRSEIEGFCKEKHLDFVTDSTNLSDEYTRNKLRLRVMPVLKELNPCVSEHISATASLMREADAYFHQISNRELKSAKVPYGYSCERLLSLDPIVLKYAVMQVLQNAGAPVDHRHTELVIRAMRDGGAVDLGGGYTASCAQGIIRVITKAAQTQIENSFCVPLSEYILTHGIRFAVRGGKPEPAAFDYLGCAGSGEKINNLLLIHAIPCDIMTPDTVVRTRRAGDTFTDVRRGVTKTLKKLFNELKIPRESRDTVLLVANGSTVLWLSCCGTSAQARADFSRGGEYILVNSGQWST